MVAGVLPSQMLWHGPAGPRNAERILKPGGVICSQGECLWLNEELISTMVQDYGVSSSAPNWSCKVPWLDWFDSVYIYIYVYVPICVCCVYTYIYIYICIHYTHTQKNTCVLMLWRGSTFTICRLSSVAGPGPLFPLPGLFCLCRVCQHSGGDSAADRCDLCHPPSGGC